MQSSNFQCRGLVTVLCLAGVFSSASCATMTGLVSGAFTGAVDAPAEIYRHYPEEFRDHPLYWPFNVIVFVPVGFVLGPVVGLAKGIALDMEHMIGQTDYGPVFHGYDKVSIWRPYSFGWHDAELSVSKKH